MISFYDKDGDFCFVQMDKMVNGYVHCEEDEYCVFTCETKDTTYQFEIDQRTANNIISSLESMSV